MIKILIVGMLVMLFIITDSRQEDIGLDYTQHSSIDTRIINVTHLISADEFDYILTFISENGIPEIHGSLYGACPYVLLVDTKDDEIGAFVFHSLDIPSISSDIICIRYFNDNLNTVYYNILKNPDDETDTSVYLRINYANPDISDQQFLETFARYVLLLSCKTTQ